MQRLDSWYMELKKKIVMLRSDAPDSERTKGSLFGAPRCSRLKAWRASDTPVRFAQVSHESSAIRVAQLFSFFVISSLSLLFVLSIMPRTMFAGAESFDVIIRKGTVYDGLSEEGRAADIGIRGDKIAFIGDLSQGSAEQIIDATGLIVAPGFIDIHTHSDFNAFLKPHAVHKISQGVTTEVAGNCGMSAAPVYGFQEKAIHEVWLREGEIIPADIPWHRVGDYFEEIQGAKLMTNLAFLVGHGNLRACVMGYEARKATPEELESMESLLKQAMDEGAFGLSLGLVYLPGTFADEAELTALAAEVKNAGGILTVHMRSEGKKLIESLDEVLALARKTGVPLEISHLKAAGVRNWPKIDEAISMIEKARNEGLEIHADAYPYEAAAAELGVILPDEIYQAPDRLAQLQDINKRPAIKKRTLEEFEKSGLTLNQIEVARVNLPEDKSYEGKTIAEIAEAERKEPVDAFFDLLARENFQVSAFSFTQNPAIVSRIIAKDYVSIGSDNIADFGPKPHPRVYGTFPRVIEKFVKKEKTLSLGQAIHKMSRLPAQVMGIEGRGSLEVGNYADVVIFDLDAAKSNASYENPAQLSSGIEYVLVNGRTAWEDGGETGVLAGQVLRHEVKGSVATRA